MEDILTGGYPSECGSQPTQEIIDTEDFLRKSQYLGEFSDSAELPDGTIFDEKAKVRDNLNIYSRPEVEDMVDREHDHMLNTVNIAMQSHLDGEDPHGDRAYSDSKLSQQSNTFNTQLNNLKNNLESQIERGLVNYAKNSDFEAFKSQLIDNLTRTLNNVYTKDQVYNKTQINNINQQFVKTNGTTPFTKPQEGVDPQLSRHLATKRYVDNAFAHAVDFLNNTEFRTWINQKLAAYAKLSDTYNRNTIDNKLDQLVESAVDTAINRALTSLLDEHVSAEDPHGDRAYTDGNFVRKDQLSTLTLDDFETLVEQIREQTNQSIEQSEPVWQTSGPVQTTVGFVEDNTDFNGKKFTLQGIMDAIFYGKAVQIFVEDSVILGETTEVTIYIHGPLETVDYIIIKQGDTVIAQLEPSDLDDQGRATVMSNPILEDTVFTVEVYYQGLPNPITAEKLVKVGYGVFVGIIDKYQVTTAITWDDLLRLTRNDPTNNKFFTGAVDSIPDIEMDFDFESPEPKQILIAAPSTCPDISEMFTKSQQFGIDAFNIIQQIPLTITLSDGTTKSVLYKYTTYKQGLVKLSTKVNFKF